MPLPQVALQNLPGVESGFAKWPIGGVLLFVSVWKLLNLAGLTLCGICVSRLSKKSLLPPLLGCALLFLPYLLKRLFGGVFVFFSLDTLLETQSMASGSAVIDSALLWVCTLCLLGVLARKRTV